MTATLSSEAEDYGDESKSEGDNKKEPEPTKKKVSGRAIKCVVKQVVNKEFSDVEKYMARNPDMGSPGGEREAVTVPEKVVVKIPQIYCKKLAGDNPHIHGRVYKSV